MAKFYVYLIKSENKLTILREPVDSKDYQPLMNNEGDAHTAEYFCKIYCLGYIAGSQRTPPINKLREFE